MKHFISIADDGLVSQVYDGETYADIAVEYDDHDQPSRYERHPAIPADAIEVSGVDAAEIMAGGQWKWTGKALEACRKPDAGAGLAADLSAYAAQKRWEIETGGILVNGVPVATDDRSKLMILSARIKAESQPGFTTRWKTSAGFVDLAAPGIIAISDAIFAHVAESFAVEAAVNTAIASGAIITTTQIDEAQWPASAE